MRRPRIAVTLSGSNSASARKSADQYLVALRAAGADPIPIRPEDRHPIDFDGLCLTGGGDISPALYGETRDQRTKYVDDKRDRAEGLLLDRALANALPVLGICRGLQFLNVHSKGKLIQHVEGHEPPASHMIQALAGSRLARAIGDQAVRVNSYHHQAVSNETVASDLLVTARVGDIVEALESSAHRWVVGVQWHPERTDDSVGDPESSRILLAFVETAAKR